MADDKKISDLTAAGALSGAELVEIVQGGVNKKSTTQDIADLGGGGAGTVQSVTGDGVDNTDPDNPVLTYPVASDIEFNNIGGLYATNVQAALESLDTDKLNRNITVKSKTASHTLDADDLNDLNLGKDILFLMNVASGHNFTIPENASIDVDGGGHIYVMRVGLGQTTFVEGGATNITSSSGSLLDPGANVLMPLIQTSDNQWYLQNGSGGEYTTWNPGFTGFSVTPSSPDATYVVIGKLAHVRMSAGNGTSNAAGFTITGMPVAPRVGFNSVMLIMNNGATAAGRCDISAGGTTITLYATAAAPGGGGFTTSGNKNAYINLIFEVD